MESVNDVEKNPSITSTIPYHNGESNSKHESCQIALNAIRQWHCAKNVTLKRTVAHMLQENAKVRLDSRMR